MEEQMMETGVLDCLSISPDNVVGEGHCIVTETSDLAHFFWVSIEARLDGPEGMVCRILETGDISH